VNGHNSPSDADLAGRIAAARADKAAQVQGNGQH